MKVNLEREARRFLLGVGVLLLLFKIFENPKLAWVLVLLTAGAFVWWTTDDDDYPPNGEA